MDISSKFSLEDFLAYLFPGVIGTLGIYYLFLIIPFSNIDYLQINFLNGVIFFIISYLVGILLSSFSEAIIEIFPSYKSNIPQEWNSKMAVAKLNKLFIKNSNGNEIWSKDTYYLCRSYVYINMPQVIPLVQRQSSLRQLRINILPVYFIFLLDVIVISLNISKSGKLLESYVLFVFSLLVYVLITIITYNRAKSNERREVREVISAILIYQETIA